jgi:LmbE family N-acetylglucosaminyl deacetylase
MPTSRIAAIVAHPDDEVLLCGATLARHADSGGRVHILILATGLAARARPKPGALAALRRHAAAAARVIGASELEFGDFRDNAMDGGPLLDVVRRVERFLAKYPVDLVYTHHGGDLNVDHRIVHQAVTTAMRPLPGNGAHAILAGEVNSATEWAPPSLPPFVPSEFVPVADTLERKLEALRCYAGELRDWPHPRSLEGVRALARWRGTQAGVDAAEAFMTVRRVWSEAP